MIDRPRPMATCPNDGAPLISTLYFAGAEFYCLECGSTLGFLSPSPAPPTPELEARYETLRAEWDEHVAGKLLTVGAWHRDCEECAPHDRANPHIAHATDEEVAAHEAAAKWLKERCA